MQKKMFKVISPVDKGNGNKYWMRCGSAFVNVDDSINVYLDALPLIANPKGGGVQLQLREYSAEELRERAERRSTYSMRGAGSPPQFDPNGVPPTGSYDPNAARGANPSADVPF